MATINQLIKKPRKAKKKKVRCLALKNQWNSLKKKYLFVNRPQVAGVIKDGGLKILSPAKPNSASRACARISLSNRKEITVYIPGVKHNLQSFSSVLIQGGGAQDVRGVKLSVVRGNREAHGVENRKQGRSLYGTKKPK